jgi:phenylalanyl-tRNA synthetase beta subunit
MIYTRLEIKDLVLKRKAAREAAIIISKKLKPITTLYADTQAEYKDKMTLYNKLDKECAFALFDFKKAKNKQLKKSTPYNAAKRTAAKALKALESLPKELRDKIIADAQDGLF